MKGILRVHDGNPITERSGIESGLGHFNNAPIDGIPFLFWWEEGVAQHDKNPSPGIVTCPKNLKQEGDSYMFEDEDGRLFDLKILERDNDEKKEEKTK